MLKQFVSKGIEQPPYLLFEIQQLPKPLSRLHILGGIVVGYLLFASEPIEHLLCFCLFNSVTMLLSELSELLDSEVSFVLLVVLGEVSLLFAHFVRGLCCCFDLSLLFGLMLLLLYGGLMVCISCFWLMLLDSGRLRVFGLSYMLMLLVVVISLLLLLFARLFCGFLLLVDLHLRFSLMLSGLLRFLAKFILLSSLLLGFIPILRLLPFLLFIWLTLNFLLVLLFTLFNLLMLLLLFLLLLLLLLRLVPLLMLLCWSLFLLILCVWPITLLLLILGIYNLLPLLPLLLVRLLRLRWLAGLLFRLSRML